MLLKAAIFTCIVIILLSLTSGLFFLFKDMGKTKFTVYSLGVRVSAAIVLLVLVAYGLYTGQLGNQVPWAT